MKLFVLIFGKLNQINNIKSRKVATFENCEIFSNYYFSYVPDYKATLSGGNNNFNNALSSSQYPNGLRYANVTPKRMINLTKAITDL